MERRCIICGKVITDKRTRICSDECRKKNKKIHNAKYYEQNRIKKKCIICGKPLPVRRSKTCSDECARIWLEKRKIIDKNHISPLGVISVLAREEHLSYGRYVAKYKLY